MNCIEFELKLETLIQNERTITHEILLLINEAETKGIHLQLGYSSLFDWLTRRFKYSEGAAQRRLQAARLLKNLPEVSEKILSGEVNLTTLSKTESFIKAQEKASSQKLSVEQKSQVLEQVTNKSTRDAEKTLFEIFPNAGATLTQEKVVATNGASARLTTTLDQELIKKLEEIKLEHSHTLKSIADVIEFLANNYFTQKEHKSEKFTQKERKSEKFTQKERKIEKAKKSASTTVTSKQDGNSRSSETLRVYNPTSCIAIEKETKIRKTITPNIRKSVVQKAGHRCEYIHHQTGTRCTSRFQLEVDHIYPQAWGGDHKENNLRCLCRAHNQFMARKLLGHKVEKWRKGLMS